MSITEQEVIRAAARAAGTATQPRHRIGSGLYTTSGFFVMRSPTLPVQDFLGLSEALQGPTAVGDDQRLAAALRRDRRLIVERLLAISRRPAVREALHVASPSLVEQLDEGDPAAGGRAAPGLLRGLNRYIGRMTCRATPFGLFAGCSLGHIDGTVSLRLGTSADDRRHTRLDMNYLTQLCQELERDPLIRARLRFRPNPNLYEAADRWRYVESRVDGAGRSHHLVAVDKTTYLEHVLQHAAPGVELAALAAALLALDSDIERDEALAFVDELAATQILVSELTLPVTGRNASEVLLDQLSRLISDDPRVQALTAAQATLSALDAGGRKRAPRTYHALARDLAPLSATIDAKHLVQVDLFKTGGELRLNRAVAKDILRGVEILYRLRYAEGESALDSFQQEFTRKYEEREVPLTEVLDDEIGLGFETSRAPRSEESPLLAGLRFPVTSGPRTARLGAVHDLLLSKFHAALTQGADEIELDAVDLKRCPAWGKPLPDSLSVMCTLASPSPAAVEAGDYRIYFKSVTGPPGTRLLGRFCHLDDGLHAAVAQHLRHEEAHRPDAIYAEIVHLPEGRLGNILFRPQLRPHEITLSGRGSVDSEHQIALTDLYLRLEEGRLVLRSRRLGKEIIPRLTSAHNFGARNIGLYRFLCTLQLQGVTAGLGWYWGALDNAPYLPRVTSGRLVLMRARWRWDHHHIEQLTAGDDATSYQAVQRWRRNNRVPRLVELVENDNCLPIDLDNVVDVDTLLDLAKKRRTVIIEEFYPGPQDMPVSGPNGTFSHELVVPVLRQPEGGTNADDPAARTVTVTAPATTATASARFLPGSEWLYMKIYCGGGDADRILVDTVAPLAVAAAADDLIASWFFIRYRDPDMHLRIRLRTTAPQHAGALLERWHAALAPLVQKGLVHNVVLESYARETERYGGAAAIAHVEEMFAADSAAVVDILTALDGDADARWRVTLAGSDRLLADLGLDLDSRHQTLKELVSSFRNEFRVDKNFNRQVGVRFRQERATLDALIDLESGPSPQMRLALEGLRQRQRRWAGACAELRRLDAAAELDLPLPRIARSLVHMHANRLLRAAARAQELVIYDLLYRVYDSRLARARRQKARPATGNDI